LVILISSAGRRVELINCFRSDALELGINLRIIATDANPALSSACQVADAFYRVPKCNDFKFISELKKICEKEKVSIVIPTIDTELSILANARDEFESVRILVSETDAVDIARNKFVTAETLRLAGISTPETLMLADLVSRPDELRFPVILKKIDGSSSIGLFEAGNIDEVLRLDLEVPCYIAQEKMLGREYTINCFVSERGELLSVVPHQRLETRGGEVSKGRTERHAGLINIAEQLIIAIPGLRGPFCFQAIVDKNENASVFEINARFGGGFPLAHQAGALFSKWIMEESLGLPTSSDGDWEDGLTMLRYDSSVFVRSMNK